MLKAEEGDGGWEICEGGFVLQDGKSKKVVAFERQVDCERAIESFGEAGITSLDQIARLPGRQAEYLMYRYLQW